MYPMAWLLLMAPLVITASFVVGVIALVIWLLGWGMAFGAFLIIAVLLYSFGRS